MTAALLLLASQSPSCIAVDDDRILARHLALSFAELRAIPQDAVYGFAPRVGVRRTLPAFAIAGFARKYGLTLTNAQELCVVRTAAPLTEEAVLNALQSAAAAMSADRKEVLIELIEYVRGSVPSGTLEFPASGLAAQDREGLCVWRGYITSSSGTRYPIWARLRVTHERPVVTTRVSIAPGSTISPEQLVVETRRWPLSAKASPFASLEELTNYIALQPIAEGQVILHTHVQAEPEVRAGEPVTVTAGYGFTKLTLEATAETPGLRGSYVTLRNPLSGKRFRAIVTGPKRAEISGALHAN